MGKETNSDNADLDSFGFARLSDRAVIQVKGPDCVSFLQGVVTNDVTQLQDTKILYSLMLTPQGRFHFECMLHEAPKNLDHTEPDHLDSIFIDTDAATAPALLKRLKIYKLRADVTLTLMDEVSVCVSDESTLENYDTIALHRDPRHPNLGYRGIDFTGDTKKQNDATDQNQDQNEDQDQDSETAYHTVCLSLCIPRPGRELISEKTIPLEANMEALNAICFEKGCYLGQELTTRTKHQGLVRKHLFSVRAIETSYHLTTDQFPLTLYAHNQNEIKKAGELLSFEEGHGIAKLRDETIEGLDSVATENQEFVFSIV